MEAIDTIRRAALLELEVRSEENAAVMSAVHEGVRDLASGVRHLPEAGVWRSPAHVALSLETELLADSLLLVADAAGSAASDYRKAHAMVLAEAQGLARDE